MLKRLRSLLVFACGFAAVCGILLAGSSAKASTCTWTGAAGVDWSAAGNWASGGTPGSGDIAEFASASASDANLTTSVSAGGIWVTGAGELNISKDAFQGLTLNGATINGNPATGIEIDAAAGPAMIEAWTVTLGGPQTWRNNSSSLLEVEGINGVLNNGNTLTIAGTGAGGVEILGGLSGAGGLIQNSSATLQVNSGVNSWSGPTTISAGTFVLGTLINGSNITVNGATAAFSELEYGLIEGAGTTFTLTSGSASLTTVNTFTGGTTVNGGTLSLGPSPGPGHTSGIIQGNLTINSRGTVNADLGWSLGFASGACVSGIAVDGGVLNFTTTGAGDAGGAAASTITMTGGTISGATPDWYNSLTSTPTLATNGSTATAVISSGFNLRLSGSYLTFNVAAGTTGGADLLVSGPITQGSNSGGGVDGIVKTGAGMMSLTAANSYGGPTTIAAGTLQIGNGGSGESLASPTISNSGALVFNHADTLSYRGAISGNGQVTEQGGGMLVLSGNNTYTGATTVNGSTLQVGNGTSGEGLTSSITMSNNAAVAFNHADPLSYSGTISGSGQLIKLGTGNLNLVGSGTYSGPTTISAGTLELDGNGDNLPAATALTIAASGVLDLAGNPLTVGSLSGPAGAVVTNRYASYPATLTVAPSAGSTTFAGNIIGRNAMALSGSGKLTLSGTNAYTGGTTVSGGTLDIAAPSALSGSGLVTIAAGGRLVLGSGAGIGALLAASSPVGSGAVALSAPSVPATIGGYENESENMATLGGAPPLSQGGGGSAVGGTAAAVPEPAAIALLAAGVLAAATVRRKRKGC